MLTIYLIIILKQGTQTQTLIHDQARHAVFPRYDNTYWISAGRQISAAPLTLRSLRSISVVL